MTAPLENNRSVDVVLGRPAFRRACLLSLAFLLWCMPAFSAPADTAKKAKAKNPDTGWVSLFNGKDLTGWVKVGAEKWAVEEGVIHGQGISTAYGYLRTEKKYVDFQMSLRFKCEADGNSGLFFRTELEPNSVKIAHGLQFEIDRVVGRHSGGVVGDGRGFIALPSAENELVIKPNDWNDLLVIVQGNRYFSRLNGVVIVDHSDNAPVSHDGYIALQLHSGGKGEMRFKDLYIRDLTKR